MPFEDSNGGESRKLRYPPYFAVCGGIPFDDGTLGLSPALSILWRRRNHGVGIDEGCMCPTISRRFQIRDRKVEAFSRIHRALARGDEYSYVRVQALQDFGDPRGDDAPLVVRLIETIEKEDTMA